MAAKHYGLEADHSGMARCPFHDDQHPSLKLYGDHFYCFGCGASGSVIDLTAGLFGLSPYEAACKLAEDFSVDVDADAPPGTLNSFRADLFRCQRLLEDYLNLLHRWKNRYRPRDMDELPDERYVEACQMLEPIDYLASILAAGTLEQRIQTVDRLLADGKMDQLEERLIRIKNQELLIE